MPRDTVRACTSVKVSVCPPDRRTAATTRGRLVRAHLHAIVGRDLRELLSVPRKRKSAPRVVGAGDDVSNALASVLATVTSGDDGGDVVFRPAVVQCQCCQRNEIQSDTHRLTVENNNSGWGGWGGGGGELDHNTAQRSAAQRSAAHGPGEIDWPCVDHKEHHRRPSSDDRLQQGQLQPRERKAPSVRRLCFLDCKASRVLPFRIADLPPSVEPICVAG
jgi:hypothetical protein